MASFDEVVPPGQAGKVTAALRTDGLAGSVSKTVTVTTDDPARPTFTLTLRANIVASVDIFPVRSMYITMGLSEGAKGRMLVRKTANEAGSLEVSGLSSSAPWLKVSARKVEGPEPPVPGLPPPRVSDWVIEAKVEGEPPAGQTTAQVKFKTGLAREPEIEFPVVVRVPPPLSFSPAVLDLYWGGDPAQPARGTVFVLLGSGLDGEGLKVESLSPSLSVEVSKAEPRKYKVDVTWKPAPAETAREAAVVASLGPNNASMAVRVNPPPIVKVPSAPQPAPDPGRLRPLVPPQAGR